MISPGGKLLFFKRLFDPRQFRCAMCSMGGVGSTALARHIGSISDKTVREHAYSPEVYDTYNNLRLGYMFGNPYNAVLSVFRRNFQHMHAKAMNANTQTQAADLSAVDIDAYLERGVDEFQIERQFDNWIDEANAKHPTILIKYEGLTDTINDVLEFFEMKKPFVVRARKSTWQAQPEHRRAGLERMYGGVAEKIDAMPNIKIIGMDGSNRS